MTEVHYTPPTFPAPKQADGPASLSKPKRTKRKRVSVRHQRRLLEQTIERLVELLDAVDPDPDLEQECEDEGAQCEDEGAEHDGREPSLGSLDSMIDQTRWAHGDNSMDGLEQEHDGREPSLGWQNTGSQGRLIGGGDDREEEHDGREPDYDNEANEQGFTNPDSAQYHTREWRARMRDQFGD
jgi:hypothetical protein